MIGPNCIYFKPTDSGGMCNHLEMRRGFWFFSYRKNCILTQDDEIKCELMMPKIIPVKEVIKMSKPKPKPKRKALHIHKEHIHKKEK